MTQTRVTVMGLGHFGGGAGVTRWLVQQRECRVLLTDLAAAEQLADSLDSIRDLIDAGAVALRLGGHEESDFRSTDLVVANPAVPRPWENRFLNAAREAGVPITTEIELLIDSLPDRQRIIGVTGTAGKSTTSAMIHHVLRACFGAARLGGNIGGSLLGAEIGADEWVVLELSSAMLWWMGAGSQGGMASRFASLGTPSPGSAGEGRGGGESSVIAANAGIQSESHARAPLRKASASRLTGEDAWSPHIAVITNFSDNHADWHGSLDHYRECKQRLLAGQRAGDHAILGPGLRDWPTNRGVNRLDLVGDDPRLAGINLLIPGRHNRLNAMMAAEACRAAGVAFERAIAALADFRGLPHRLELVSQTPDGRRYYNDSKCTTPAAAALAVESFDHPGRLHVIVGGYDKKADLAPLAALGSRVARLYAIGAVGERIHALAPPGTCLHCRTLDVAVKSAMARMKAGDILLLSPGCASWDQFTNFEQRGERFTKLVQERIGAA